MLAIEYGISKKSQKYYGEPHFTLYTIKGVKEKAFEQVTKVAQKDLASYSGSFLVE